MPTLHIFDFDDTLVRSDSVIRITHADGSSEEMTSEEYAKYVYLKKNKKLQIH